VTSGLFKSGTAVTTNLFDGRLQLLPALDISIQNAYAKGAKRFVDVTAEYPQGLRRMARYQHALVLR
jgi:hypothetical protein